MVACFKRATSLPATNMLASCLAWHPKGTPISTQTRERAQAAEYVDRRGGKIQSSQHTKMGLSPTLLKLPRFWGEQAEAILLSASTDTKLPSAREFMRHMCHCQSKGPWSNPG